jgi:hypothetical protein
MPIFMRTFVHSVLVVFSAQAAKGGGFTPQSTDKGTWQRGGFSGVFAEIGSA